MNEVEHKMVNFENSKDKKNIPNVYKEKKKTRKESRIRFALDLTRKDTESKFQILREIDLNLMSYSQLHEHLSVSIKEN